MADLGGGAPAMMYRREAPKPGREPGFILPLIGCGCMYRTLAVLRMQFFHSEIIIQRVLQLYYEQLKRFKEVKPLSEHLVRNIPGWFGNFYYLNVTFTRYS